METYNCSRVWEYLLIISPPEEVKHSIGKIKKEVGVKYGSSHALHSIAHISLVRFLMIKGYERNLLTRLFSFCINTLPFGVTLDDFDVFPRHTLYVNVQENEGIKKLQNGLMVLLISSVSVRGKYVKASKKHHMTIARNLNPSQFDSVSTEYKRRQLNTSFRAKNVVLLKRPYDEYNLRSYRWNGSHNFVMGY
jgi:2'-5' RNA ligase